MTKNVLIAFNLEGRRALVTGNPHRRETIGQRQSNR